MDQLMDAWVVQDHVKAGIKPTLTSGLLAQLINQGTETQKG